MTEPKPLPGRPAPAAPPPGRPALPTGCPSPAALPAGRPPDRPTRRQNARAPMPEQELTDVFERAIGDAAPDLGLLVAGATAEGRSLRLRRRATLTGVIVAVAGLGLVGGLLLRPGPPTATTVPPGSAGTATAGRTTATPTPETTLPSERVPLTGPAARLMLGDLLDSRLVVDYWTNKVAPSDLQAGTAVMLSLHDPRNGHTGTLMLQVEPPAGPSRPQTGVFGCTPGLADEKCDSFKAENGTVIARRDDAQRITFLSQLQRTDGVMITLISTGAGRNEPLVSQNEISKWVLLPGWQPVIDRRLAEDAEQRLAGQPALSPAEVAAVEAKTSGAGSAGGGSVGAVATPGRSVP
ncbi:hypothetical protein ACFYS8_21280 [Kitasatospora sp. NPDC004615]|uniref:hypothetical protein n=1 Tax=Kitasatospora sp. NPDC004615 TaxID=3364017 RepID=UPI003678CEDB